MVERATALEIDLTHGGIDEDELRVHGESLQRQLAHLDASDDGGFLRVPSDAALLKQLQAAKRALPAGVRDIVQLGIGGSSLGAQALCSALLPPRWNEGAHGKAPRIHFPDNIDPETFGALLDSLDPKRTLVHVVSKSGGTIETAAQLAAVLEAWGPRKKGRGPHFVVTTGAAGSLRDWAEREAVPMLAFPESIAGRFSVFTASGLLVPALCGVPVARILAGARAGEARCRGDALVGPAGRLAALHYVHDAQRRRPIHVELIYGDGLVPLGAWFAQIWAESLGKQGKGPTPIVARGTTDQHSQIQLYVDGPDDKVYTILRRLEARRKVRLGRRAEPALLAGRGLAELFEAEALGTLEALVEHGRPLVEIRMARATPESVGELLLLQQLQTALAGALYGVYPFDQPGVEAGKKAAVRILSGNRSG